MIQTIVNTKSDDVVVRSGDNTMVDAQINLVPVREKSVVTDQRTI